MFAQGVLQLTQAAHPQPGVGGPVGLVERTAGRLDGTAHVLGVGIGGDTEHLFGGRIDRCEGATTAGHQLAVDEQPRFAIRQDPHPNSCLRFWTTVRLGSFEP